MNTLTEDQMRMAFALWYPNYDHADADNNALPFLRMNSLPEAYGQLKRTRKALLLTTTEVSGRLGVNRSVYSRMESTEENGTIKIETLTKAAEAMDCELVYALRPKCRRKFSEIVWEQLVSEVISRGRINSSWPDHIKIRSLASSARDILQDPKFRRQTKWSERWRPKA